jgi:uncharacterized Fe-S cluster-containing radical SAM superfamily enzyme
MGGALGGLKRYAKIYGRDVFVIDKPIPLVGHIAFGIVDRGTNVLQVRPSTLCFHSCIYCSVDAGPESRWRRSEYIVEKNWLIRWVKEVAEFKGENIEVLLDGVGEPLTHPSIVEIIREIRKVPNVKSVALETHGGSLSKKLLEALSRAGLSRINLSIDTLDPSKARILTGSSWYDVRKIIKVVEWAFTNTDLDFILTPVVLPGINEDDMEELIEWAKSLGLGKKVGWPTGVLIQKFEVHKFGRKVEWVREWTWGKFYRWLTELERRTKYRLIVRPEEIGMKRSRSLPKPFKTGDRVPLIVLGKGWLKGELLAVDALHRRVVTLIYLKGTISEGSRVVARIIRDKDNIFIARK